MVGKGSATPPPPSALSEYFRVPLRPPGPTPFRTPPKEVSKRRRHRMRSFSARAEGIQNALFASRLGPLMNDDATTREWSSRPEDNPWRKGRVVIRRRNMRTTYRRSLGQDGRSRTAVEVVVNNLWVDFDKENRSPGSMKQNGHARKDGKSKEKETRRDTRSSSGGAQNKERTLKDDVDKMHRAPTKRRIVFRGF